MNPRGFSRRDLLKGVSSGFGYLAFAGLSSMAAGAGSKDSPLAPKAPHFPARARRVIFLCMNGAPSHVDTFDYKPELASADGKASDRPGRIPGAKLMGSPWKFQQRGESGLWVSELFPEVAAHADELCVIRSMQTDLPAHPEAYLMLHTGSSQFIRPSLGAWTLYGLGTESDDLPGFIAMKPTGRNGGAQNYGSAFLPAACQATRIGNEGQPIVEARVGNIKNPRLDAAAQRLQLDLVQSMNRELLERERVDPGVEGVIESYELAFRMQGRLPGVMDLAGGVGGDEGLVRPRRPGDRRLRPPVPAGAALRRGRRPLRRADARRLGPAPRPEGRPRPQRAGRRSADRRPADGPARAGPARRDAGDLGRRVRPHAARPELRRPRPQQQGILPLAGRRRREAGIAYGQTDELGYEAVENPMHVHDLHATILHLLGLDHERLTYRYAGRDMRLTDVKGVVHKAILA